MIVDAIYSVILFEIYPVAHLEELIITDRFIIGIQHSLSNDRVPVGRITGIPGCYRLYYDRDRCIHGELEGMIVRKREVVASIVIRKCRVAGTNIGYGGISIMT